MSMKSHAGRQGCQKKRKQRSEECLTAQYQRIYREREARKRSVHEFWYTEDLYGRDGEKGTYEIADPSVNIEEELIH